MKSKEILLPVPDILKENLQVVFCGINPGVMTSQTQHHFARPGNKFWKTLHLSGFTPQLFLPAEQQQLPALGVGITNLVARPSVTAQEITKREFQTGAAALVKKIKQYSPRWLAVLGIDAYRKGFGIPFAVIGKQPQTIGRTQVWLLPNPSGLNAHYSLADFVRLFSELRQSIETEG